MFFKNMSQNCSQNDPPNVTWYRGKSHGGAQGGLFWFQMDKSGPRVLQKWPQRTKNCVKKGPEFTQKCNRVAQRLWNTWAKRWPRPGGLREAVSEPRPGGLREALTIRQLSILLAACSCIAWMQPRRFDAKTGWGFEILKDTTQRFRNQDFGMWDVGCARISSAIYSSLFPACVYCKSYKTY